MPSSSEPASPARRCPAATPDRLADPHRRTRPPAPRWRLRGHLRRHRLRRRRADGDPARAAGPGFITNELVYHKPNGERRFALTRDTIAATIGSRSITILRGDSNRPLRTGPRQHRDPLRHHRHRRRPGRRRRPRDPRRRHRRTRRPADRRGRAALRDPRAGLRPGGGLPPGPRPHGRRLHARQAACRHHRGRHRHTVSRRPTSRSSASATAAPSPSSATAPTAAQASWPMARTGLPRVYGDMGWVVPRSSPA